jgi:hypothetical protein
VHGVVEKPVKFPLPSDWELHVPPEVGSETLIETLLELTASVAEGSDAPSIEPFSATVNPSAGMYGDDAQSAPSQNDAEYPSDELAIETLPLPVTQNDPFDASMSVDPVAVIEPFSALIVRSAESPSSPVPGLLA